VGESKDLVDGPTVPPSTLSSHSPMNVQCAWNCKMVTSALTFDIKGYFDFVNHNRLLSELRHKHIPLAYVKWVASFLTSREAAICIDGKRGTMGQVDNGIPQGSPISPILAAFYTSDLLEQFQPKSLNPANQEFPTMQWMSTS
jgi:hypothetical protein